MDWLIKIIFFISFSSIICFGNEYETYKIERNKEISDKLFGTKCENEEVYRNHGTLPPTILVSIFVRNKEYALPFFLKCLYDLDYPKDRISLWFVADHNHDNSVEVINKWLQLYRYSYHSTHFDVEDTEIVYKNQLGDLDWTDERYIHLMKLKQRNLEQAFDKWADFAFFIDADTMLLNPCSLWHLIAKDVGVIAPMLDTVSAYSNFWCAQNEKTGFYMRSDDYLPIRDRKKLGAFQVVLVHSAILIDLTKVSSRKLQFWPPLPDYPYTIDDFIVFIYNTKVADIPLFIDNSEVYGYMALPVQNSYEHKEEITNFVHLLSELMTDPPVGIGIIPQRFPDLGTDLLATNTDIGFDKVYMINLVRRPDRYIRMDTQLKLLGIEYEHFKAVDSKYLNNTYLKNLGVQMLEGYSDPYKGRPLTYGEIGCFLSHYFIWKDVVEKGYQQTIVFEDDVRFERNFFYGLNLAMNELKANDLEWDLIYLGRKRLNVTLPEDRVNGTTNLVWADYSYWTVGYLLSLNGAKKLLEGKPLGKMVPVDEYLPIMYDKHPKKSYWEKFPVRNLIGFSIDPLVIYPTHYTGQNNHYSDTETSVLMYEKAEEMKKQEL